MAERGLGIHPPGTRVVVRHALERPDPRTGARLTDVVGTLVHAGADVLVVDTPAGRVTVSRDAVVATRVIPPRPSRRGAPHRALSVEDLERVMVGAWPPAERQSLGSWVLRASGGFTSRANSALVVGHPDRPLPSAVEAVTQWYAARHLSPALALPIGPGQRLRDDPVAVEALRSGWAAGEPVQVMTAATRSLAATPTDPEVDVELSERGGDEWFAAYARSRVAPREHAEVVLHGSPAQSFGLVRGPDRTVVAVARLGVSDGWGGLGAMWVQPSARGRGLGRALVRALSEEAATRGCVSMHLQVDAGNEAAIGLYEEVGFTIHHTYAYLTR